MGFLYFVEGRQQPTRDSLRAMSFPQHADAAAPGMHTSKGPSGSEGYVFVLSGSRANPLFDPTTQSWFDAGGYWLGYRDDAKPGPESLQRRNMVRGPRIRLGDGNSWFVPRIQHADGTWAVDCVVGLNSRGKLAQGALVPRFKAIGAMAAEVRREFAEGSGTRMTPEAATKSLELIGAALAMNYHVDRAEVLVLELFDGDALARAVLAVLGMAEAAV